MIGYRMNGEIYTEDQILEAIQSEVEQVESLYRENGAENPEINPKEYLEASVNTGTIERIDL